MEQDRRQILPYHLQWFAKEAREDGKVAKSKELTAAFDLIVMFLMLKIFVSTIGDGFLQIFYYVYNLIPDFIGINAMDVSTYAVMSFFSPVNIQMLKIVAPFFIFGFAVTLLVNILQVGWKVSTKPMQPKLDRCRAQDQSGVSRCRNC